MKHVLLIMLLLLHMVLHAQTPQALLYKPLANAESDIIQAVKSAKQQNRMVLLEVGGNWCSWCVEFNRFCKQDKEVDSILNADFVVYHLNYSPENKNSATLAKYGYPQRFGFPVFLILNENGNLVHTQNSTYLEQGRSYNKKKVTEFFLQWNRKALHPAGYRDQ